MLIAFNKPYGVLSQFSKDGSAWKTLKEFNFPPGVYPLGRLDANSEGLLLLSDEPKLNARLLNPKRGHVREYWAQVERIPTERALEDLAEGVILQGRRTLPCRTWLLCPQPEIPPRNPPIRYRKSVETCWLGLALTEGKNHQVRQMTASIGHPTLRLIRIRVGQFDLGSLPPGSWKILDRADHNRVFS